MTDNGVIEPFRNERWGDDRTIQGWRQGVIASSWFRLRGNPKFFTLSNLLFSFLRLRKVRSPRRWGVFPQRNWV